MRTPSGVELGNSPSARPGGIDEDGPIGIEELISAGLYDPKAPRTGERLELLQHLLSRGFTVHEIVTASRGRIPTHLAAALTRPPRVMVNAHEVARKSGLSLGQVISLRLALGFAVTDPGALELPESVIEDVGLFKFAIDHFGEERALALARVIGDGVARIVEATRAAFSASVVEASMTELEISLRNETTNAGWLPLEAAVGHLLREWSGRGYEFFAAILDGDAVLAVGFVDLVGSTAWTMAARPAEHTAALMRLERLRGRAQSRRAAA